VFLLAAGLFRYDVLGWPIINVLARVTCYAFLFIAHLPFFDYQLSRLKHGILFPASLLVAITELASTSWG
jgi:hypothetical protein